MENSLRSVLTAHRFVHGMSPEHLEILCDGARLATFHTDQILFDEGEPANEFYLIQYGKIALEAKQPGGGKVLLQILRDDDVLGWSWLFSPYVWHLRARVLEPTRLIVFNAAHLLATAERDHDFGYGLMKRVVHILITRFQFVRRELLEHYSGRLTPA